jgi:uncharacterized membrane protein
MFWHKKKKKSHCLICRKTFFLDKMVPVRHLGPSLIRALKYKLPKFTPEGSLCTNDLRAVRIELIRTLFDQTEENIDALEDFLLREDSPFSFNQEYQNALTLGERCSQKITPFIGSWGFILLFVAFVTFWISYNLQTEVKEHFDPYPFILLNLTLSCMAAIQAPIIMMAQSRLAKRERLRADEDYYTNLKAELEIRQLTAKIDAFLKQQK